jgi:hypothetical protein
MNRSEMHGTLATITRAGLGSAAAALALVLAATPAAQAEEKIPQENLVKNPSFDRGTKGWGAMDAKIKRVKVRNAPNGKQVARVTSAPGASEFTLDDAPATVRKNVGKGRIYTGAAWVKGTRANAGEKISIIVREWSKGEYVDSASGTRTLKAGKFTRVKASYTSTRGNGEIDVYLARTEVSSRDRFFADAITLTRRGNEGDGDGDIPAAPVNPSGGITTSQIALGADTEAPLFTEQGTKYRYIIIRDNLHDRVSELRELHPEAQLILYKNVGFTLNEPGCPYAPFQGGGLSYCDAQEDWFLHDSAGNRLSSEGYPNQRAMNIGNPGYQQAWLDSVLARLRDAGNDGSGVKYDGVWLDDTNTYPGHGMDGRIKELTDAQYGSAMVNFIHNVSPQIRAAGFTTIANVGMNPWETAQRANTLKIAQDVSAVNREGLIRWGEGQTWAEDGSAPHWMYEVELAEDIQAAGADFHAITYGQGSDVEAQRYARATFLLAWNGQDGSAVNYRTDGPGATYLPNWTTDVGVPTSARYRVGQGIRRDYSGGTVIVNARASGGQSFDLGGSFRRPDGSCVSSVSLGATKAMVMPAC